MTREKEARALSAKQKEPEQRLSLPRILRELPEALRADLEFWSTYDSARYVCLMNILKHNVTFKKVG